MKDNRTVKVDARLTPEEKEKFKEYCQSNNTTISNKLRELIQEIINKEGI